MPNRSLHECFKVGVFTTAALLTLSTQASLQDRRDQEEPQEQRVVAAKADDDDDDRVQKEIIQLPSGQYVTPTVIKDAVQQYLNPRLPDYPDFIAGMAVRSQLSPDGTTLAILTAGQNSLYKPDGTVDARQLDAVHLSLRRGGREPGDRPRLKQVIKQTNAHVGLVFSPDGNTLYAAGGNDDAVYVYTRSGGTFTAAAPIPLGHFPPGSTGSARNRGVGINVQPNASGMDISADGATLVVANNYNDSISVIDTATRDGPLRARSAAVLRAATKAQRGGRRRDVPVRRGREWQRHRLRVVGPRSRGGRRSTCHRRPQAA